MSDPWHIGPKLRYWRKRRGIGSQAFGDLIGRSHSWVNMAEKGRRAPYRLDDLVEIAVALRVDLGAFVCTPVPGVPDPAHQQVLSRIQAAFGGRDPREGLAGLARTIGLSDPGTDLMLIVEPTGALRIVNRREALQTGALLGISLSVPSRTLDPDQSAALATSIGSRRIGMSAIQSLRTILGEFRRLDDQIGSSAVRPSVLNHLRMVQALRGNGSTEEAEAALSSVEAEFAQFIGWLSFDTRDYRSAERYFLIAFKAADAAGDDALAAHVLKTLSLLEIDRKSQAEAIRYAEVAAKRATGASSRTLCASTASTKARAYGHAGRTNACKAALAEAEAAASEAVPEDAPHFLYYFDQSTVRGHRGIALSLLGESKSAQAALEQTVASIPAIYVRDKAYYCVCLAMSLAGAGEIPEACRVGNEVVDLLNQASSRRTTQHLQELDAKLVARHRSMPEVRELHERVLLVV
jgi:transcriptional regulator with XRE-family HTH domain/tetratricopeptide (TPR) repeat protein